MPELFDRSLLPEACFEFVVITDTHYMLDPGDRPVEFESRRRQSACAATALAQVASLQPNFVVHLGDLLQEYPETPDFERALEEALPQLRAGSDQIYMVAGNQDVGDKPDPTMPTRPVEPETLEAFHRRFGSSWYSFDHQKMHFVVLNAQLMNADLAAARDQAAWLERDLAAHAGERIAVFMHLPLYLKDPTEPHLGHYDNLGEPARAWLLDLLQTYQVELLFAGHVHFAFCDGFGPTRYWIVPSTSFTRPGFSHLFTSGPPPEQGRDDTPKFGFYLCRAQSDHTDMHFIRTRGALENQPGPPRLLTPAPSSLDGAALGLTLTHPLSSQTEVPVAWPSVVRQPVRNDYPLLACLELGAARVRVPWTDLENPEQKRRLALLHREGVAIQAFSLWSEELPLSRLLDAHNDLVDTWEIQLAGGPHPPPACLDRLRTSGPQVSFSLARLVSSERVPGKQHPRTRIGYLPPELPALDQHLQESGTNLAAAQCRLGREAGPWNEVVQLRSMLPLARIERLDLLFELPSLDDEDNTRQATEALFAARLLPGARFFCEPFVDLDRTMDVRHGLLDTRCNPRPPFEALRCLNAVLHSFKGTEFEADSLEATGMRVLQLHAASTQLFLLLPDGNQPVPAALFDQGDLSGDIRLYHLVEGTVEQVESDQLRKLALSSPTLIVAQT